MVESFKILNVKLGISMNYENAILYFLHYHELISNVELAEQANVSTRSVERWVAGQVRPITSAFNRVYRHYRSKRSRLLSHSTCGPEDSRYLWSSPGEALYHPDWCVCLFTSPDRYLLVYEYRGEVCDYEHGEVHPFYDQDELLEDLAEQALLKLDQLVEYVA